MVTVRTLALYLNQTDRVPIFSLPLPSCELNKIDMSLTINVVGQSSIPPFSFVFETEKDRDIWYLAIRKATRISAEEVTQVIELQNDIVAHYGLPFEKARLPWFASYP